MEKFQNEKPQEQKEHLEVQFEELKAKFKEVDVDAKMILKDRLNQLQAMLD